MPKAKLPTAENKDIDYGPFITELYSKYNRQLYCFLFDITKRTDSTEEILAETWSRIIKSIPAIYAVEKPFSYLIKTAANTCKNYFKLKATKSEAMAFEEVNDKAEVLIDYMAESDFDRVELSYIWDLVTNLEEPYRSTVLYFYQMDFTYKEISQLLNITENNIGVILLRARKLLKDDLKKGVRNAK